jgi:putative intracellular protease/amidase
LFQVLIPLANANEEMEVIMTIDALRRAKADAVVASAEDKLEVAARYGMRIVTDMSLDDAAEQQFDLIVVPASSVPLRPKHHTVLCVSTNGLFQRLNRVACPARGRSPAKRS